MTSTGSSDQIYHTIISASELEERMNVPDLVIFDCRFSLADPSEGEMLFLGGHIPGAFYAHLDEDLSSPVTKGVTGRHPLPDAGVFADFLMARGVNATSQVVCYDDKGGAIASRMWWLCKWIGLDRVAVLDGGIQSWIDLGGTCQTMIPALPSTPGDFAVNVRAGMVADAAEVLGRPSNVSVLDARAAPRYRGEDEPIDPVAGHIRGALSAPFVDNLADGSLLSKAALHDRFATVPGIQDGDVICYCGSGVTAAHNALAITHAGYPLPRLYPGSWSEWIVDTERPIETGEGTGPQL